MLNNSFLHELQTCAQKNPFLLEGKNNYPQRQTLGKNISTIFLFKCIILRNGKS